MEEGMGRIWAAPVPGSTERTTKHNRGRGEDMRGPYPVWGQDGQLSTWVLPVSPIKLLIPNGWWTKWRVGKRKFTRWYIGVSELFNGIHVTMNFLDGIHVKDSCPYPFILSRRVITCNNGLRIIWWMNIKKETQHRQTKKKSNSVIPIFSSPKPKENVHISIYPI